MAVIEAPEREEAIAPERAPETLLQEGFRAFLRLFSPESIVGISATAGRCPLAGFMSFRTGRLFHVWNAEVFAPGEQEWVERFIRQVDAGPTHAVTAEQALAILDEIV